MIKTIEGRPSSEKQDRLFEVIEQMKKEVSQTEMEALVREYIEILTNDCDIQLSPDVTALYQEMERRKLLLRLESATKIFEALLLQKAIDLGTDEKRSENAVIPAQEGIAIAFAEGETRGPIRTLVGFDVNSAIGFDSRNVKVDEIEVDELDMRNTALRKAYCRHVSGQLPPEDLQYLVLRIPRGVFPKEILSDEEMKKESKFIVRGARVGAALHETQKE